MLDIQNKCSYGSSRGGSRSLAIYKTKIFVAIDKCPVINYSTRPPLIYEEAEQFGFVGGSILHLILWEKTSSSRIQG